MTTLIPTSQHQQASAATATATPAAGAESYEDMFKEITRKLYGDESAHGLYPINNAQVAQLAQTPSAPPEGERSFTTLVSDRSLAQLEYENVMPTEIATGNFKSEEHLSTAFGLAALMHNGFPPPTINFPVTSANNAKQSTQSTVEDRQSQWNQQQQNHHQQNQTQQQQQHDSWSNNKTSNSYTQKLFKVKTKQEPVAQEIILNTSTNNNVTNGTNIKSEITQIQKRYNCSVCPYMTDRRDLFTRHENIHKEEKPFHCYACLKQFNRADHVKKHFLRMHREMEYDINKTRRYPPSSKQVNSINNSSSSNNNNTNKNNNYFYNQQQSTEPQLLVGTTINIPTFTQNQSNNISAQQHSATSIIEHVVQNSVQTIVPTSHQLPTVNIKHEKTSQGKVQKIKGEKRFMCCYCPWSGADNWGLKRHLNTHTKPFVCLLCDYKAARSERLTTHIFKVHNKKACNKCNFFADDQAQLAQHQLDAHQNEVRNVRTTNNQPNNHPTTTALTVNNVSTVQPVASVANNQSTTNVLRTLTNTFVPNINHTPQTNHTFGSSNTSSSLNNVSSIYTTSNVNTNLVEQLNHHLTSSNNWRTVNPTNNSLSNLNLNLNGSNRIQSTNSLILTPTITTTSSSLKRKSGAERLFAYFEADDSDDIELDYARQLQMQAISRNTASVAQDFRSAGGENFFTNAIQQSNKGNITLTSVSDAINTNGAIGLQQKRKPKATSPIDHSPPAVTFKTSGLWSDGSGSKRRRKMSPFSDKENVNELLTKQLTFLKQQHMNLLKKVNESDMSDNERLNTVLEINEMFETMYNKSLSLISSFESNKRPKVQQQSPLTVTIKTEPDTSSSEFIINYQDVVDKRPKIQQQMSLANIKQEKFSEIVSSNQEIEIEDEKFSLPDFLTNNNEITVIMESKMQHKIDQAENRKNRKQLKPKKIEKLLQVESKVDSGRSIISDLRDKHMVCLVTRKKYCFACRNKSSDANTFFGRTSLLLHKLWRHSSSKFECTHCQLRFSKIYKLKLHKKLKKH